MSRGQFEHSQFHPTSVSCHEQPDSGHVASAGSVIINAEDRVKKSFGRVAAFVALGGSLLVGCATAPKSEKGKEDLSKAVVSTMKRLDVQDSGMRDFLNKSYGYVIFPVVGKGGFIFGGAYGRGEVYEQGQMIGYADITQGTVGLQAGGQTYTEVIAFETKQALEDFKSGKFAFAANASAVALKSGASAAARYTNGIAVFFSSEGGAMVEAAVGGQSFTFQPI